LSKITVQLTPEIEYSHVAVLEVPAEQPAHVVPSLSERLLDGRVAEADLEDVPEVAEVAVHDWSSNQELLGDRVVHRRGVEVDPARGSGRFTVSLVFGKYGKQNEFRLMNKRL
jgi:hypothetical protein